jgi:hypothetical protein
VFYQDAQRLLRHPPLEFVLRFSFQYILQIIFALNQVNALIKDAEPPSDVDVPSTEG